MTTRLFSFKSYNNLLAWGLFLTSFILSSLHAQCPTISNNAQSFCDIQDLTIGNLEAIDNGGGIFWYESLTSTTPLLDSEVLINGEDYYADDSSGNCGPRQSVVVTIIGPPSGQPFQGFCLDDANVATIADLVVTGNDVQWYLNASGGSPLSDSTVLIDGEDYFADQANPDTGCRTSRLEVEVIVRFVPIPTGDLIQEFCVTSQFTPTIADLVASGSNNWYISLFFGGVLPESTPLINGQNYYATTVDSPCESAGRLPVLVLLTDSPDAGINGFLDICADDLNLVDLFNSLGSDADSGGTWSPTLNSGTGVFNPAIDSPGQYTYTIVGTPPCPNASATVDVSILTSVIDAGEDGSVNICSNGDPIFLFNVLQGTPQTGGTWSPALVSGTDEFNPAVDLADQYTYTIAGITPCPDDFAVVTVTRVPEPDAGEDGSVEVCSNDDPIFLFDILQGTPQTGGTWSPALASGTDEFNPAIDLANQYTYTVAGAPPCPEASAVVIVTIIPEPDAGEDGSVEVCITGDPIFLFDVLQGTPQTGGTWSPALNSGTDEFNPAIDPADQYTYTVPGTPPCSDAFAVVTVTIAPETDAGEDGSVEVCSNNDPIFLFDVLQGTPQTGGTWSPALASGTDEFNPAIDPADQYTYTVAGATPCPDASAVVTVTIVPEPNAGDDGSIELCSNDDPIFLFDVLQGAPQIGGTWSPALASGTDEFNPAVDPADQYTYTVAGTPPCADASAVVTVTLVPEPDAGEDGSIELCNNDDPLFLFDILQGTPQAGGTWSPALASGTDEFNPAVDPADQYTYTVTGSPPCSDASAIVIVTIAPETDAGEDGSVELCSNDGPIFLFDVLQGAPQMGGTWSPALASGTDEFNPAIDLANQYTYTVAGTPPCNDASAVVTVTITAGPDAGEDGSVEVCLIGDPIFLFDVLQGTPQTGGTWSPALASGTDEFNPAVDPADQYTYTVAGTPPCSDASAVVTVTIAPETDAGEDGSVELCSNDDPLFLFDVLQGTPQTGGTWSPALASGTDEFDPAVDPADQYTYTVAGTPPCNDASAVVTVTLIPGPNAGEDGSIELCIIGDPIFLFNVLQGTPETGGTWSPALTSGTDEFNPAVDPANQYTYTVAATATCPEASAVVTVTLAPITDAGEDGSVELCSNDDPIFLFDILQGTPQTGGTWSPALASGTDEFNPVVDLANQYTYTVAGTPPCNDASAVVTVTLIPGPDAGEDASVEVCSNGDPIFLFDILQGTPQTGGTWSPALASGTDEYNPTVDPADQYTYTVAATATCSEASAVVTVTIIPEPNAGLDSIVTICIDDAPTDLFNFLGPTADSGGTWFPVLNSGTGIFDPTIDTEDTYTYTVISSECNLRDVSSVTVIIGQIPDVSGTVLASEPTICLGSDISMALSGANQLIDGTYTIDYTLTGTNTASNTIDITVSGGNASFTISSDLLQNSGSTVVTITGFYFIGEFCSGDTDLIASIEIDILETPTPQIVDKGNQFCSQDNPTIFDLNNNILDSEPIIWYRLPEGGIPYSESDPVEDGVTYYGAIQGANGCESTVRLQITASVTECPFELIIPDGFSPNNGDAINDEFHIVNLDILYPNFKLSVYNRYGNILYEGNINSQRWDGTSKNSDKVLPVGVYFYILEFNDGERNPIQGRVYLGR
jgi:gliding motility-associated-like protein